MAFCAIPCVMTSVAACGDDEGNEAFGGGGGGTAQSTSVAVTTGSTTPIPVTSSTGGTTSGAQSGGGEGGAGDGGSSSSDGGSTSEGGGGSSGDGGSGGQGGGVVDQACDDGCVPFPSDGGGGAGGDDDDCDDDGDPNQTDCQPCDPSVFHGQVAFFDEPYEAFTEGAPTSFDYDCSGGEQLEYAQQDDGCTAFTPETCPEDDPIITSDNAVCGETGTVQGCHVTGALAGIAGTCTADGGPTNMAIRCH